MNANQHLFPFMCCTYVLYMCPLVRSAYRFVMIPILELSYFHDESCILTQLYLFWSISIPPQPCSWFCVWADEIRHLEYQWVCNIGDSYGFQSSLAQSDVRLFQQTELHHVSTPSHCST